ncbi:MAG TPA: glycosyltransferase family 2 protein [Trinickia sp.]|uniref:glycosyltransferase family 2 protein n=1 Tax=Trinickia sp. TaxID=2571163 RepID=UPI002C6D1C01|nr:glycosyltransferase family 2 protein [Trinickia sp.]HVW52315.1 glycosyltransferase family 2 protein [Trinickia sp.]
MTATQDKLNASDELCQPVATMPAGVSIVVPVFRSAATLDALRSRLARTLEAVAVPYEILLVEDGGNDGTWDVIRSLARASTHVKGIRLSRNYGQHNALLCGIRAATMPVIVTLDDDLQNPPEEVVKLIALLQQGYDVVYGTPEREQHNFWRDQASRITKMVLQGAMGAETARHVSAFRAFRTSLRDAFHDYRSPFVSIDVLLTWGTTRFAHLTVRHEPRVLGVSNYTFRKLFNHAMNMMTGYSTLPLQAASVMGFGFTAFGFLLLLYVVGSYLFVGSPVRGFTFVSSMIAIFSGAQMFAIGVIGEYLARMHFRSMDRPVYTVAETVVAGASDVSSEGATECGRP